jgi:hypothetical protein
VKVHCGFLTQLQFEPVTELARPLWLVAEGEGFPCLGRGLVLINRLEPGGNESQSSNLSHYA